MQTIDTIIRDEDGTVERQLRWVSADGQGEYTGWTVPAGADPWAVLSVSMECLNDLLRQCGTEEDAAAILAGSIEVYAA